MIPKLGCCKFAEVLFVFIGEILAEFNEHLIGHQLYLPHITCGSEHTSHLKHDECQIFDGSICQWVTTSNGYVLHFAKMLPECFDGVFGCPRGSNACMI